MASQQRMLNIRKLWEDFTVTEADLNHPTPEFVMSFLLQVLDELYLREFVFKDFGLDKVLNMASATEGSKKIIVCTTFNHIFAKLKGMQFGLEDIIDQVPQRFGKQVDILIHLVQYLDFIFGPNYNHIVADCDRQCALQVECLKDIDVMTVQHNEMAIENKKKANELKAKLEEKTKYIGVLNQLKGKVMETKAVRDQQKAAYDKLVAETKTLEEATIKQNKEMEEVKGNIIQSPDSVYSEKVQLMDKRKELEERHSALSSTSAEKGHLVSEFEQIFNVMEDTPKLLKELMEKHTFSKNLKTGILEDELNLKKTLEKVEDIKRDFEEIKTEMANFQTQAEELSKQHAATMASLENKILAAKEKLKEAEEGETRKRAEQVQVDQENEAWKEKVAHCDWVKKDLERMAFEQKIIIDNQVAQFCQKIEEKLKGIERKLGMNPVNISEILC